MATIADVGNGVMNGATGGVIARLTKIKGRSAQTPLAYDRAKVASPSGLNLRAAPNLNSQIYDVVPNMAVLDVLAEVGQWLKVIWRARVGYIFAGHTVIMRSADVEKSAQTKADLISSLSEEMRIDPRLIKAVIAVESSDSGLIDGEVVIRFEAHEFAKQLVNRTAARTRFSWDAQRPWTGHLLDGHQFHGTQRGEYLALEAAIAIATVRGAIDAPYRSISMGIGQIMGFHAHLLDYDSAQQMLLAFSTEAAQLRAMFKFIENSGLAVHLRRNDLLSFARGYNGSDQAHHYADLLASKL